METAYRRAGAAKRGAQRAAAMQKGEKRRLIQLAVSLALFLVVFFGQDAFPAQLESWKELVAGNTDFAALFDRLRGDLAGDGSLWSVLGGLTEGQEPEKSPPDTVTLLSETDRCGLQYVREHSFLSKLQWKTEKPEPAVPEPAPTATAEVKPQVVTAMAQAYSAEGEALPKKVSFQFYELGLEQTVSPVLGPITSQFGYRTGPISGKREFHLAIDIGAAKGTEIRAFADGVVRYIGKNDSFGLYLMIDHDNGAATFYAHCSKLLVRKGDAVTCGQTVALVGDTGNATGPHLHFTLSKDGIRLDPTYYVDPTAAKRS